MNKTGILAFLLGLTLMGTAWAEESFGTDAFRDFPSHLQCGVIVQPSAENDPIYKVDVDVHMQEGNSKEPSITTTYTSIFGKVYDRSDQYEIDLMEATSGMTEILWTGHQRSNPKMLMLGRLWKSGSGGHWFYSETLNKYTGPASRAEMKVESKIVAGCHVRRRLDGQFESD